VANDLQFERLGDAVPRVVNIEFEGRIIEARRDDSVAAALLAAGERVFRET
jgi:hypothetical protein